MSSKRERNPYPKTWDVGNELHWRRGFSDIGSTKDARGALGSSGILPARPRKDANRLEDEDTLTD